MVHLANVSQLVARDLSTDALAARHSEWRALDTFGTRQVTAT